MNLAQLLTVFVAVLLVVSSVPVGAAQGASDSTEYEAGTPGIVVDIERVPGSGVVEMNVSARPTAQGVAELQLAISRHERISSVKGFADVSAQHPDFSGEVYQWDQETQSPSLTLTQRVEENSTTSFSTDSWWMARTPYVHAYWAVTDRPEVFDAVALGSTPVDGHRVTGDVQSRSGVVTGGYYTYVGEYTQQQVDVPGRDTQLNVIVAPGASFSIGDEFGSQISDVQVFLRGEQPVEADLFVLPSTVATQEGRTSPQAAQTWISDDARLENPANLWLHEYIHLQQQSIVVSEDMQWYVEGVTTYQTVVLNSQVGGSERSEYYISRENHDDAVLSSTETWGSDRVPYDKGSRVLFGLDTQLREVSEGEATLLDVIEDMHQHEGEITYDVFRGSVVEHSSPEVGEWLDTYVHTSSYAPVPESIAPFPESDEIEPEYTDSTQRQWVLPPVNESEVAGDDDRPVYNVDFGDTEQTPTMIGEFFDQEQALFLGMLLLIVTVLGVAAQRVFRWLTR